ncbi:MAG: hypothetical protein JST82_01555 [Bacteroidetes bacterium]|nr:hypothetical protein [Bacteroidota bacterium]
MNTIHNAVAITFPGVNTTDIVNAAIAHEAHILIKEPYNQSKDYTKFFKRSKRVITSEVMNLLFIYPDGTSAMADDVLSLKKALRKAAIADGAFA